MNENADKKELREQFTQLYSQFSKPIYRYCLAKLRDTHKAEDCMQNTFIVLYRKLQNNEDIAHPGTFLFRVADKNVLHMQAKENSKPTVSLDDVPETADDNTDETDSRIDYRLLLQKIKELLSEEEYRLFTLKYVEHLTLKQAADTLNISPAAAAKRLQRIRQRIQQAIPNPTERREQPYD